LIFLKNADDLKKTASPELNLFADSTGTFIERRGKPKNWLWTVPEKSLTPKRLPD